MCNNDVNKKFLKSLKRCFVSNNAYRTFSFFFDLQRLECPLSMTEINRCCRLTKSCSLIKVNTNVLALFFFFRLKSGILHYSCCKGLLHNKSSKRIYPATTRPQSNSTSTGSTRLQSCELSTPLPLGAISSAIGVNTDTSY